MQKDISSRYGYLLLPVTLGSRLPLVGAIKKMRSLVSRLRQNKEDSSVSTNDSSETSPTSGTTTPASTQSRSPDELCLTQVDDALQIVNVSTGTTGGIDWHAATVGSQMLASASRRATWDDGVMSRSMYIDAVKYLHGGLPRDLSEDELQSLHEHLPPQFRLQDKPNTATTPLNNYTVHNQPPPKQNIIRTSTGRLFSFVLTICILLIPIIASLIDRAMQYERQHRLTERAAQSASTAGVALSSQMMRLGQSQLGVACLLKIAWIAQNVVEGLSDGLRDGQKKLGCGLDDR